MPFKNNIGVENDMEKETIISIVAIILGAIGLFFPFVFGFPALILGFYAYSKDEMLGLVGFILGTVGLVINALMVMGVIPWFFGLI